MSTVAKKLSALEKAMMELAYESRLTEIKLKQLAEGMEEFKAEMKAFKDEMKAFKDEMKDFKDEMKDFKDEMKAFKDEMKDFKDEMKDFKDEMKDFKDEMNKKWGDLARKMGTLVEDIFVPSLDLAFEKYFGVKVEDLMPRRRVRKNGATMEVDILALAGDLAFVVEVKASPNRAEYVHDFMEKLSQLPGFIPEVRDKKIVPVYAALDMAGSTVDLLTKNGIYAMVVRGDILEIVNFDMLRPVQ
ncbi:hypothetical protein SAMN02745218_00911 [Desulfofundulus australicus DSM 11792]|uniref:DUF3782 domain-containing protein n=1 Tax=Desulfofundulus australicus DSM 11792 TaxID=1121425 RepID=A0A1M4WS56_9FIRM|nr:hypothetical protein [Desulfofundulus australicus]SHE84059.1 hypothetical protein SAMN02745218_00911 [Desulfofundulus australicus DSM 11792]